MTGTPHDVKDLSLAAAGHLRIDWAELSMPVLRQVRERFTAERQQEYLASWTHGT